METFDYDVFVSYASRNRNWVVERLLGPLRRCRRQDGSVPRICVDRGRGAIEPGAAWVEELHAAIRRSRKFVPVYSRDYFDSDACQWEANTANTLDLSRRQRLLIPVLLDPTFDAIPGSLQDAQFLTIDHPDWFHRLCDALDLEPEKEAFTLRFRTPFPATVVVNNTLPIVEVEVTSSPGALAAAAVEVTLSSRRGDLRGELNVVSRRGVAAFGDLIFGTVSDLPLALLASADGCVAASSSEFRIINHPRPKVTVGSFAEAFGEPMFFADGQALLVVGRDSLRVVNSNGALLGDELPLRLPLRLTARHRDSLLVADWSGLIRMFAADGSVCEWHCPANADGLAVAGALLMDDAPMAGFWSGDIYELRPGGAAVLSYSHRCGVQALARVGGELVIADFEGNLVFVDRGSEVSRLSTGEKCIHTMSNRAESLVLVAERSLLKHVPGSPSLFREAIPVDGVFGVLSDVRKPIVCDRHGRGFRFDTGLTIDRRFQVSPGARPTSADHQGEWAVFQQQDGSHLLLHRHGVVLKHALPMAVSSDGRQFAVGEEGGLRIMDRAGLDTWLGRRSDG